MLRRGQKHANADANASSKSQQVPPHRRSEERRCWRGKKHFEDRGGSGGRESRGERYFYRIALLTPRGEENRAPGHLPLLFGSLQLGCVFFHLAPGCVLKVLSKACVSKLHEETKKERGEKTEAEIKAYFLTFLRDSSSPFWRRTVTRKKGGKKKTKHTGAKLLFVFSFTFAIDLNFSWADMLCSSPMTSTVLNSSGSNTSCAQPINHRGAWQTNHLLMKWGSHEFLTAFVLFIKPDQTMKTQTSLKGKGGSHRE